MRREERSLPEVGAMTLDEIERAMIEKSLRHYEGNVSRVAESLGLSRAALYRRMEKYDLKVYPERSEGSSERPR
jgi:DNA-binding NtrC family response regulator